MIQNDPKCKERRTKREDEKEEEKEVVVVEEQASALVSKAENEDRSIDEGEVCVCSRCVDVFCTAVRGVKKKVVEHGD